MFLFFNREIKRLRVRRNRLEGEVKLLQRKKSDLQGRLSNRNSEIARVSNDQHDAHMRQSDQKALD